MSLAKTQKTAWAFLVIILLELILVAEYVPPCEGKIKKKILKKKLKKLLPLLLALKPKKKKKKIILLPLPIPMPQPMPMPECPKMQYCPEPMHMPSYGGGGGGYGGGMEMGGGGGGYGGGQMEMSGGYRRRRHHHLHHPVDALYPTSEMIYPEPIYEEEHLTGVHSSGASHNELYSTALTLQHQQSTINTQLLLLQQQQQQFIAQQQQQQQLQLQQQQQQQQETTTQPPDAVTVNLFQIQSTGKSNQLKRQRGFKGRSKGNRSGKGNRNNNNNNNNNNQQIICCQQQSPQVTLQQVQQPTSPPDYTQYNYDYNAFQPGIFQPQPPQPPPLVV